MPGHDERKFSSCCKESKCLLVAPGSITSPTIFSGRTPSSSSRGWRPMAWSRWRKWTALAKSSAPARAKPIAARRGSRNGVRSAIRSRSAAMKRWPRVARSRPATIIFAPASTTTTPNASSRRAPRSACNAPTPTRSGTRASGSVRRTSSSSRCLMRGPPCQRCS